MSLLLKNGGWRGVGEFATIRKTVEIKGITVQICSYNRQLDQNGQRRSREYYEIRTAIEVTLLPAAVKTLKAAKVAAENKYGSN